MTVLSFGSLLIDKHSSQPQQRDKVAIWKPRTDPRDENTPMDTMILDFPDSVTVRKLFLAT